MSIRVERWSEDGPPNPAALRKRLQSDGDSVFQWTSASGALLHCGVLSAAPVCVQHWRGGALQGNVRHYCGGGPGDAAGGAHLGGFAEAHAPRVSETMRFGAALDDPVVGLLDPAH